MYNSIDMEQARLTITILIAILLFLEFYMIIVHAKILMKIGITFALLFCVFSMQTKDVNSNYIAKTSITKSLLNVEKIKTELMGIEKIRNEV